MRKLLLLVASTCVVAATCAVPAMRARAALTGPDLSVTMSATPNPVMVYNTITYTINAKNNQPLGGLNATGVSVTDTLIDDPTLQVEGLVPTVGSTITSASSTYAGSSCSVSAPPPQLPQVPGTLTSYYSTPWMATCTLGTLPPQTTATMTVTVSVQRTNTVGVYAPNPVVNTVAVTNNQAGDGPDPNPANNAAETSTTIKFAPDVSVAMTPASTSVAHGGTITYTITVTNNEPTGEGPMGDAAGVTVDDTLGDDASSITAVSTSYVNATGCSISNPAPLPAPWKAHCDLNALPAATSATITLTVTVSAAHTASALVNTVSTHNLDAQDPDPTNDTATATATVS